MPASASASSSRKPLGSSSSKMSSGEIKLYKTVMSNPDHTMGDDQLEQSVTLPLDQLMEAINGLLRKSLLTISNVKGKQTYTAISRSEASLIGSLDTDETIIYQHIKEGGDRGIWTKSLKARSNLHQTVMTRVLKNLEQRQLVKVVKDVKTPTRKIYMLANLTPAADMSGGPWYTDNELDTVFIEQLCGALHRHIAQVTWPQVDNSTAPLGPLHPASHSRSLPTASSCLRWLKARKVTDIELDVEHVNTLLQVLVYDDKIEKIPSTGFPSFSSSNQRRKDPNAEWQDGEVSGQETASESEDDTVGAIRGPQELPRALEVAACQPVAIAAVKEDLDANEALRDAAAPGNHLPKARKGSERSTKAPPGSAIAMTVAVGIGPDRSLTPTRIKTGLDPSQNQAHTRVPGRKRPASAVRNAAVAAIPVNSDEEFEEEFNVGGELWVYRAIKPFSVHVAWTETPCGHCPVFDFCEPKGPVNAEGCIYMDEWIYRAGQKEEDEDGEDDPMDAKDAA
ncbi:RNA polymerase III, subunit C34 [Ceraceosorus bombacis]|uniref:RNA polymerase III, subunit C34 n=1 Tax=Ceraceosorus bombacis TaxID=401625 RepID=A0A0P1BJB9_9BASI|nr:RNA polymerase III, subunit C34 [Ceraceosorus bombacis]